MVHPNNPVLGTPLEIIFIKTSDPWGNTQAPMKSEKQDTIPGSRHVPAPLSNIGGRTERADREQRLWV